MAEKSVVITYETIFELLNREKERAELQKLEPGFFIDVIEYLRDRGRYAQEIRSNQSLSYEEKMKAERQINNLYKILKDLYERREKKILIMALDRSRTKSNIIDTSALLEEEKAFFETLTKVLDSFRYSILEKVISQSQPAPEPMPFEQHTQQQPESKPVSGEFRSALEMSKATRLVRFMHAVPKFVGTELEEYGPFQEEDVANLPAEIAELLITKGRVEEIKESN